ncbi:MAG: group II intron reverse transcriptase domain-containing protein [Candidatus Levybacteria bacterium]|nr:group II intron reverse transcriptase domain-containing protein [Candidatus Levybacteria bacterium]
MKNFCYSYNDLIAISNLFQAWSEFRKGKSKRFDVQNFERRLEDNLFNLQRSLKNKTYRHGKYQSFYVNDPKQRHIHKACVSDRIIHHLLYNYLYEIFDRTFIFDSFSCRLGKGTHRGVLRLATFARKISKNYTRSCFALKLDIKKFFASVDHKVLLNLLKKKIKDEDILWLIEQIIDSFHSKSAGVSLARRGLASSNRGIPLGNLTSQIFANIYLNELDQFVKHKLKVKYYLRYADDFIVLDSDRSNCNQYTSILAQFLKDRLKLQLHPKKIMIRKLNWGIDFLDYIVLSYYILPRTKTKRRIFKKLEEKTGSSNFNQSLQSYLGYLKHANTHELTQELKNQVCGSGKINSIKLLTLHNF